MRSGALSHAVAAELGHGSFKVTAKHYVQPETLYGAWTERLVEMLALKSPKPDRESLSFVREPSQRKPRLGP